MLSRFSHFVWYGHCIDAGTQCEKYIILISPFYLDIFREFEWLRLRQSKVILTKYFQIVSKCFVFSHCGTKIIKLPRLLYVYVTIRTTHGKGRNKGISEEATVWKHDQFTLTINFVKPTLWCTKNVTFSRNFFKFS